MKRLAVIVLACLGYLALAAPALAHPLGNFTTNVHLGIETAESKLHVLLVVDMAEIPSFRERPAIDVDRDDNLSAGELSAYATARCTEHRDRSTSGSRAVR